MSRAGLVVLVFSLAMPGRSLAAVPPEAAEMLEEVVSKEAVPKLREAFERVADKIMKSGKQTEDKFGREIFPATKHLEQSIAREARAVAKVVREDWKRTGGTAQEVEARLIERFAQSRVPKRRVLEALRDAVSKEHELGALKVDAEGGSIEIDKEKLQVSVKECAGDALSEAIGEVVKELKEWVGEARKQSKPLRAIVESAGGGSGKGIGKCVIKLGVGE